VSVHEHLMSSAVTPAICHTLSTNDPHCLGIDTFRSAPGAHRRAKDDRCLGIRNVRLDIQKNDYENENSCLNDAAVVLRI